MFRFLLCFERERLISKIFVTFRYRVRFSYTGKFVEHLGLLPEQHDYTNRWDYQETVIFAPYPHYRRLYWTACDRILSNAPAITLIMSASWRMTDVSCFFASMLPTSLGQNLLASLRWWRERRHFGLSCWKEGLIVLFHYRHHLGQRAQCSWACTFDRFDLITPTRSCNAHARHPLLIRVLASMLLPP